ncbi:MAG: RNA-binding protein [Clostridia bacterium]|jgi:ribosomal protein L14E/L6E/L27E|nr:RNA-binding protein [Clostridia bacterium]
MSIREINKGQLVKSRAGRDKDKFFLIYNWDDEFVYVVDGITRGIQNPKKKNIKHLWYTKRIAQDIKSKLLEGKQVANAEIRKALEELLDTIDT